MKKLEDGSWDHSFDEEAVAKRLLDAYAFYRDDGGGTVTPDSPDRAAEKALRMAVAKGWGLRALLRHSHRPLRGKRRGNADQWLERLNEIVADLETDLKDKLERTGRNSPAK